MTVKVRYADFTTITRSLSSADAMSEEAVIARRAVGLLAKTEAGVRPVRLAGVSVHGFVAPNGDAATPAAPWLPFES